MGTIKTHPTTARHQEVAARVREKMTTRERWQNGECMCTCAVQRVDGKLTRTGDCSCQRFVGVRVDESGPKAIHEPCTPTKEATTMTTTGNTTLVTNVLDALESASTEDLIAVADALGTLLDKRTTAPTSARTDAADDAVTRARAARDRKMLDAWKADGTDAA